MRTRAESGGPSNALSRRLNGLFVSVARLDLGPSFAQQFVDLGKQEPRLLAAVGSDPAPEGEVLGRRQAGTPWAAKILRSSLPRRA